MGEHDGEGQGQAGGPGPAVACRAEEPGQERQKQDEERQGRPVEDEGVRAHPQGRAGDQPGAQVGHDQQAGG
jgi:hypothetical protein